MIKTENVEVRPSEIQGVGVFALKDFKKDDVIHEDIALLVCDKTCESNILQDYVYDGTYRYMNFLCIGVASFLNGDTKEHNVYTAFQYNDEVEHYIQCLVVEKDVKAGDELILDYEHGEE